MLARFSHGCRNSDTRQLSSSRTVNLRQKSSYTRCNREAHKWRTNPSCKIIQQQPQRYSHKSNGRAELLVQTIRKQIKAYKIKSENRSGQFSAHVAASAQHGSTGDSTNDDTQRPQRTRRFDTCHAKIDLACRRSGSVQTTSRTSEHTGVGMD